MELLNPRRGLQRAAAYVVPLALATTATLASTAAAEPKPDVQQLKAKADRLNQQLETLTEQYNGLRVRLDQSKRAARSTAAEAAAQRRALRVLQLRIRRLAAAAYMNGGVDESVAAFAGASDPQALLDRASALRYFAVQDSGEIHDLGVATQAAARAEKSEQAQTESVQQLATELKAKKAGIEGLLARSKERLAAAAKADQGTNGGQAPSPSPTPSPTKTGGTAGTGGTGASAKALGAVAAARSKLGSPYVWGAAGPNSFDCSGLTMWAYKQVGITLPHYTGSQWNSGTHVAQSNLRPGDLVFFYSDLHHMGIYIGGGNMIHAPHTGDVVRIAPIAGRPYAGAVRVA